MARVSGPASDALERRELTIEGCEPVSADAEFTVQTQSRSHGLDLDQLVLRSRRELPPVPALGAVTVVDHDDTKYLLDLPSADVDRWLVLGQSFNLGWEATLDGESLGEPTLIDCVLQ